MKTVWLAVTVCISLSTAAGAQQRDTVVLAGVVVSATKAPMSASALTQSVTVITGEELRARGVTSVAEALKSVPGATVTASGSFGSVTSMFMRGGESRYTKFLVDGVPVNGVGGSFDLSHLTTDNVERIEIVRGPASVVHGADAVAGVINVITRRGSGPARLIGQLSGGSHGTLSVDGGIAGAWANTGYTLHGARHSTDGILPFNNQYLNETFSGSLDSRPDSRTEMRLTARATHANFHYPTDFAGNVVDSNVYRDQKRITLAAEAGRMLRRGLDLRFSAGANDTRDFTDDLTRTAAGETRNRYSSRNRRHRGEGRITLSVLRSAITLGGEYQQETERSWSEAGPAAGPLAEQSAFEGERLTKAIYGESVGALARLAWNVSARLDDPSDFGSAASYRSGLAVRPTGNLRIRATLSTSFNAPAFYYLRDTDFTNGNPALQPERGRSFEAAFDQTLPRGVATLTGAYFRQRFRQLIEYVPGGPPDFKGTYANLTAAAADGWEVLVATTPRAGWSGNASFTRVDAKIAELPDSYAGPARLGDRLIRRPRSSGTAGLSYAKARGGSLAITARYIGARPDLDFRTFPSESVTLPSVSIVNLAASHPIIRGSRDSAIELTLRVDNVFDKPYQDVFNYDAPGRTILVGGRIAASLGR